jgi:hypothetical protein
MEILKTIWGLFDGYKTYLMVGLYIAIGAYQKGSLDAIDLEMVRNDVFALGLAALRAKK